MAANLTSLAGTRQNGVCGSAALRRIDNRRVRHVFARSKARRVALYFAASNKPGNGSQADRRSTHIVNYFVGTLSLQDHVEYKGT